MEICIICGLTNLRILISERRSRFLSKVHQSPLFRPLMPLFMIACFNLCISVLSGLSGLSMCVCVCVCLSGVPLSAFICQFVCLDWRNKDIYKEMSGKLSS